MKQLKFLETKRTPRYSLRKFSVGMVSVLLGVTIFGINFTNHSVKAATTNGNSQQTSAVVLTTAERTQGINAIGAVKVPSLTDSQNDANKAIDAALNKKNSGINGATNIDQTTKDKLNQAATDAADKAKGAINKATTNNDVATERTNTQKATSATEEVQQNSVSNDVTEKVQQNVASNDATANNSTEAATDSQTVSLDEATSSATQAQTLMTNLAVRTSNTADALPKSTQTYALFSQPLLTDYHTASDTNTTPSSKTVSLDEATSQAVQAQTLMTNLAVVNPNTENTTLPKSTQTYTLVRQPLLTDYLHHLHDGKRDGNTWVDKNLYWFRDSTLDTIFGTTPKSKPGIIASHPDKYFFGAYVDYNSSYHRVILLARSQDPTDHNLYSYTIHTGKQITSSTTAAPNTDTQEVYAGASGSKYDLIFKNYQGKSYTVILKNFEDGDWGLLPVFDGGLLDPTYGSNTYDQNNKAAQTKSIGFWAGAIPQETSTKVRYVDQATGKDIVQPMEISGFGYQGFKIKGDAPTVKGYHVVSKPKFLGLPYEDGTIAPYKVGQTYDLALSDSVVIKQTVINTDGTVRATAYYNGSPLLKSASRILGRESDNDQMSFVTPDSKFHTYTNRIGQVDDSYIYYYAKDNDPKGSEMRLHFIDVTGVNNSYYAPSDGPELDVDKVQTIHGNIGENYNFTYTVPKGYDQVAASGVTGTYSKTHHDAYIYVKIDRNGAKATIENLKHLNHAQKQAAEAAIDQATDLNTMNQATSTATTLDGDMGKLSDLTADLTNTNNYKYASDKPKSTVATDYTNANVLLDKDDKTAGQNADDATVLKLIDQINTHKSSLDGDTNLSAAETTISGLAHLNDAQRSAANQAVTSASDLTGLKTAVGNAQSVDSAMSDLQTAVGQANETKTTNNYLQASADKKDNLNSVVQNAQAVLAATGANDSADQVKALTKSVNDAVDALDGDANTKKQADQNIDDVAKAAKQAIDNTNGITESEKQAAKGQVDADAQAAKQAIGQAKSNKAVTDAVNNGTVAIDKDAANAAIDGALAEKNNLIDATNLTAEEKKAVKEQAKKEADSAKTAISSASTVGDVASANAFC